MRNIDWTTCVTSSPSSWSSCLWSWCTPDKCITKTHTKLITPCMLGLIKLCQRRHPVTLSILNNGPALCKIAITRVASTKRNNEKKRGMSNPTTWRGSTCILMCNEQPEVRFINYKRRNNRLWFHYCSTSERTKVSVDPVSVEAHIDSILCPRHTLKWFLSSQPLHKLHCHRVKCLLIIWLYILQCFNHESSQININKSR